MRRVENAISVGAVIAALARPAGWLILWLILTADEPDLLDALIAMMIGLTVEPTPAAGVLF